MRRLNGDVDSLSPKADATPPQAPDETLEFFVGNRVRLGDAVKTSARFLGLKPCAGCGRRAELLNRWRLPWHRN